MKLSSLYANKPNFKRIDFNDGVNIIIGRINNPDIDKTNAHNLGKTLIVKLVDFLLLKKIDKEFFLKQNEEFKGYIFYLEIKLNDGRFVTIKRAVEKQTTASIKIHDTARQDFSTETTWDYENIPIVKSKKKKDAITVVQGLLNFDVLNDERYRNFLTYFMRGQRDYDDPFQLSKYTKGKESSWKPMLFELLGYSGKLLQDIFDITEKIETLEKEISIIQATSQVGDGDMDEQQNIKKLCLEKISELELLAKNFDFYLSDANISKELIDEIEKKIAALNSRLYKLNSDLSRISEELSQNYAYDYDAVFALFKEVQLIFPEVLKKSFEDLVDFNKKITVERQAKLGELQTQKKAEAKTIDIQLQELNELRVSALRKLQEAETFQKFNDAQASIDTWRRQVFAADLKIKAIQDLRQKESDLIAETTKFNALRVQMQALIDSATPQATTIREIFKKYVTRIISQTAMISLKLPQKKNTGNITFNVDTYGADGKKTQAGKGHTYRKEICASMDLAILRSYIDKSFCRFVIHDGCVDGDDPRCAMAYLELIKELADDGLQCIVTMIDSVVPTKADGSKYDINNDREVVLELDDALDGSGKLFGFNF